MQLAYTHSVCRSWLAVKCIKYMRFIATSVYKHVELDCDQDVSALGSLSSMNVWYVIHHRTVQCLTILLFQWRLNRPCLEVMLNQSTFVHIKQSSMD